MIYKEFIFNKDITKKQLVNANIDKTTFLNDDGISGTGWNIAVSNTDSLYRLQFKIHDDIAFYLTTTLSNDGSSDMHGISIPTGHLFQLSVSGGLPFLQASANSFVISTNDISLSSNTFEFNNKQGELVLSVLDDGAIEGKSLTWLDNRYLNTPTKTQNFYKFTDGIAGTEITDGFAFVLPEELQLGANDFMVCTFRESSDYTSNASPLIGVVDTKTMTMFFDGVDYFGVMYGMDTVDGGQRVLIKPIIEKNKPRIGNYLLHTIKVIYGIGEM